MLSGAICLLGGDMLPDGKSVHSVHQSREVLVAIDEAVWEPSSRIRWPDPADRSVHVYFAAEDAASALSLSDPQLARLRDRSNGIWMGEHGGRLALLLHLEPRIANGTSRRFVIEHEVFHLAAQYYGVQVGLNRLKDQAPENPEGIRKFWKAIERTARESGSVAGVADCENLESRFLSLGPSDRSHVLRKAFWEWPAEFYARARVFGLQDDAGYLAFRHELSPGDTPYFAGGIAMGMLARVKGDDLAWQRRIEQGENPLNIVMETLGCLPFEDDGGVGHVTHRNFVDPG